MPPFELVTLDVRGNGIHFVELYLEGVLLIRSFDDSTPTLARQLERALGPRNLTQVTLDCTLAQYDLMYREVADNWVRRYGDLPFNPESALRLVMRALLKLNQT